MLIPAALYYQVTREATPEEKERLGQSLRLMHEEIIEEGWVEAESIEAVSLWSDVRVATANPYSDGQTATVFLIQDGVVHVQYGRYFADHLDNMPEEPESKTLWQVFWEKILNW